MPLDELSYDGILQAIDLAAITLTAFNCIAACTVLIFIFLDCRRLHRTGLSFPVERRTPSYLAIAIIVSHIVFITRESLEVSVFDNSESGQAETISPKYIILNQLSWWGTFLHVLPSQ
jgi:hypothetical protein